ncbi:MAG: lipid-transfer protein [Pseudomonadota bacterium]
MRELAIVAFSQSDCLAHGLAANEVELIMPQLQAVYRQAGLQNAQDVDFVCSGSCDYLQGAAFAFVAGVDALGAVPPMVESHVEMDAAWALYEAVLKLRTGEVDSALIYGFGRATSGELPVVLSQQLDPYYLAPLWVDVVSLAAMQARLLIERGLATEHEMSAVVARARKHAMDNPHARFSGEISVDELLAEPTLYSPLRKSDCAPVVDGAAAMIICTVAQARKWDVPYARLTGIDHRIETHNLGMRDLTSSVSTELAAQQAGLQADSVDVAELYAPFSHQEIILSRAMGLNEHTLVNPSGGVMAGNMMMASGLARVGEVFNRIVSGSAKRGVAHATSGPCLQHNLVAVMEAA